MYVDFNESQIFLVFVLVTTSQAKLESPKNLGAKSSKEKSVIDADPGIGKIKWTVR